MKIKKCRDCGKSLIKPPSVRNQAKLCHDCRLNIYKMAGHRVAKLNIIHPHNQGGRPLNITPFRMIKALAEKGLGSKAIAAELTASGIPISARTVARRLRQ